MKDETVKLFATILGSKTLAESAIAYLARCRTIPTVEETSSALRVPALTAKKIVSAARLSTVFLLDSKAISVSNPDLVVAYLSDLKCAEVEHCVVLTVAADNTLINRHTCSMGIAWGTTVDASVIYRYALEDRARSIIIAHNHPSGNPYFSKLDYKFASELIQAGKVMHINFHDSIVVSHRGYCSLRQENPGLFETNTPM